MMSAEAARPRVSVGMPIYNREKYLPASIESLLTQTYKDFELIITDNGSTDRSEDICRAYTARDSRVRYHRNPRNLGAASNFRRCFELSTGEYFRWNPSDDLVSPNMLERAVEILDRDPSVFVAYPRTRLIDGNGNIIGDFDERLNLVSDKPSVRWKEVAKNLRLGNVQYGLSRADKLRKTGLVRNYVGGDLPLIAEMSLYGKFREIPDAYFYRRMHSEASSSMKNTADLMALFDPTKRNDRVFYLWTHLGANLKSIVRAPIAFGEKLSLLAFEARRIVWGRRQFLGELTGAFSRSRTDNR